MTNDDDQLRRLFQDLRFPGEPAMTSTAADDVRRGQRYLRRRKAATWSTGLAGVAALATAGAFTIPGDGPANGPDLHVADNASSGEMTDGRSSTDGATTATAPGHRDEPEPASAGLGFDATRQLLLERAVQHLDPDGEHLPEESTNTGGGHSGASGWSVSTKLDWTVPGESGLGMVKVGVTTPGYASSGEHALGNFAVSMGCEIGTESCTKQAVPGTDETAWVAEADPGQHRTFSVVHEREDGSLAGIGVYDLFGNNSLEPVSEVDVSLEQAVDFVTDPGLKVDEEEATDRGKALADEREQQQTEEAEADFSSTDTIPAPQTEDLTSDQMQEGVAGCVDGVSEWEGFEPVLGIRANVDTEPYVPAGWIIAERGDTRMVCTLDSSGDSAGAALFGNPDVKDLPYMRGPVERKQSDFGLYASDVARVTVQESGGPEQDTIMRDGYWFLPTGTVDPSMVALRGYDDTGNLVYDSSGDDAVCYADPDGTEVIVPAPDDENVAAEDCQPMVEWDH